MPKFDKPAMVTRSTTGPNGIPLSPYTLHFETLREAIRYVHGLPHGARSEGSVQSEEKSYDALDCEQLESEIRHVSRRTIKPV